MATNTGHAVYDVSLKRFVGGLHDTAAKAKKSPEYVNAPKGHDVEVRKVGDDNTPEPEAPTEPPA